MNSSSLVLDLGCGNGRTSILLTKRGYRVVGIDLSQPMLEQLVRLRDQTDGGTCSDGTCSDGTCSDGTCSDTDIDSSRLMPLRANLVQLDCLADNTADHAVCLFSTLGMIQGRQHRQKALQHASRIVRPGGKMLLHVHHLWSCLHEPGGLIRLLKSWSRSMSDRNHDRGDYVYAYRGLENMYLHRFSRQELIKDLQLSGWSNIEFQSISLDGTCFFKPRPWQFHRVGGFLVTANAG